jgi:23S rRNA-/tRNA-specific pseudouridylate synthase
MNASDIDIGACIVAEADGLVVVNKPPGICSTGKDLNDPECVQALLVSYYWKPVWALHQLDKDTSGINLFVRKKSLVDVWKTKMQEGGRKEYLAICRGRFGHERLRVDAPLGWIEAERGYGVTLDGKPAATEFELLSQGEDASLLRCRLLTGRTHQIRLHLGHVGHPLLGENRYLDPPCRRHRRQALHAARLSFEGGPTYSAPLPDDLRTLAQREGLSVPEGW